MISCTVKAKVIFMRQCAKRHHCVYFRSCEICAHVYDLVYGFAMYGKFEQRVNDKFCIKLGKSVIEILSML